MVFGNRTGLGAVAAAQTLSLVCTCTLLPFVSPRISPRANSWVISATKGFGFNIILKEFFLESLIFLVTVPGV